MDMSLHIWSWLRLICIALRLFSSRRMDPWDAEVSAGMAGSDRSGSDGLALALGTGLALLGPVWHSA